MEEDIIHDMEEVNMEEAMASSRSEFAAVIFHDIPETYPADADIHCQYTLTCDIYPSTSDYIGLYKVGWMSYRDYVYYEWAPWPENYEAEKSIDSQVTFPAKRLPSDDGEFYQFCYVMKTGQIRGASMPFQFKSPSADDFVEEEAGEDGEMLVIRSKTVYLEEKLKVAEEEKSQLLEAQKDLERERESLINKMADLTKQLDSEKENTGYLKEQLKLSHDKIQQLNKEEEDMILLHDQLQEKINVLQTEKDSLEQLLTVVQEEISESKQIIKTLQNEKDELMGKNQSLEQEKELYKSHVSSSESVVLSHQKEVEDLKVALESSKEELNKSKADYVAVKVALETEKSELQKNSTTSKKDKMRLDELKEALRNVEDKLAAEENTKKMLSDEIQAFQVTQQKMSRNLEDSELELDKLREMLNRSQAKEKSLKENLDLKQKECESVKNELRIAQIELSRLKSVEKEVSVLQGHVSRSSSLQEEFKLLQEQHEKIKQSSDTAFASHFALKKANNTLKERLAKAKKRNEDLYNQRDELKKKQEQKENDLSREVKDLTDRIHMCSTEYKALFQKNRKLQKKIDKVEKFRIRVKGQSASGENTPSSTDKTDEEQLELSQKVEFLTQSLDEQKAKKEKYKKLYLEEKEKREMMRKHYHEEANKAEQMLDKLKCQAADMGEELALKCRSMQNLLSQKEKQIEELTRSRCYNAELQKDKNHKQGSPKKGECGADCEQPGTPKLIYPNPYERHTETVCYPPQYANLYPAVDKPIQYPDQTVPGSSASAPTHNGQDNQLSQSVHLDIDSACESDASGPLDPILQPTGALDPPLQPTVTAGAKMAAVKSAINPDSPKAVSEDFVLTLEKSEEAETFEKEPVHVIPSAPVVSPEAQDVEEERYQDAAGEAMKICPSCNQTFSHDVNERDFQLHMVGHFGKICPLCDALMDPNCSTDEFQRHVDGHF